MRQGRYKAHLCGQKGAARYLRHVVLLCPLFLIAAGFCTLGVYGEGCGGGRVQSTPVQAKVMLKSYPCLFFSTKFLLIHFIGPYGIDFRIAVQGKLCHSSARQHASAFF